jgi:uroporphyrin-III C-methyltransferase
LVLYDALVDDRVLALAPRAQRFFVGKRAGRHAITQDAINALLIRAVRRGRRVVRLKGGDPFVFGRGGEEVAALNAAGIAVEMVPGISSALAAPALAGIPLTYRGVSSAFLVVSGHDQAVFDAAIAGLKPGKVTIVVLMAVGQAPDVARRLRDGGWAGTTPAALVMDASLPRQQVWRGTLDDLAGGHVTVPTDGAGTIVVGDVVALAADAIRGWGPEASASSRLALPGPAKG